MKKNKIKKELLDFFKFKIENPIVIFGGDGGPIDPPQKPKPMPTEPGMGTGT